MSSVIDADVLDAYVPIEREIESAVNELLQQGQYSTQVRKWAVIVLLTQVESPESEWARFHRRDGVAEFRMRVPFAAFSKAGESVRRRLVFEAVASSLQMFAEIGVQDVDTQALSSDLHRLASERRWH